MTACAAMSPRRADDEEPTSMSVPARAVPMFADIDDVARRLAETGYLPDTATATAVFLADRLGKPLLVEGPAGVGKTELARAVAQATGSELVRLQCYEGVDEARALYEWNHAKQILRIQAGQGDGADWDQTKNDVFSEEFLLTRPLLTAIRRTEPTVLLIDETDKADIEIEGLLLEVLRDFAVTVPELGTITADAHTVRAADLQRHPRTVRGAQAPLPVPAHRLPRRPTSNGASCCRGFPNCPSTSPRSWCASSACCAACSSRSCRRSPRPSTGAARCWRWALDTIDDALIAATLGVVLKHQSDQIKAGRGAEAELMAVPRTRPPQPLGARTAFRATWWSSWKRCADKAFRWDRRRPSTPAG